MITLDARTELKEAELAFCEWIALNGSNRKLTKEQNRRLNEVDKTINRFFALNTHCHRFIVGSEALSKRMIDLHQRSKTNRK